MVPSEIQTEVYATVKKRNRTIDATWAPWWRAQARAEAAVLTKLHPSKLERVNDRLAKELAFADNLEGR